MKPLLHLIFPLFLGAACVHQESKTALRMDHTFQLTQSADTYRDFATRGFIPNPFTVDHPGQKTCQFLHFREPGGFEPYLEFCFKNSRNPQDNVDIGQEFGGARTGIALAANQDLEGVFKIKQSEWAEFKPIFVHKNYDWAKDSTNRLPGWNFVGFEVAPVPKIFIWMSESEKSAHHPESNRSAEGLVEHPNSARSIRGFLWGAISEEEKQTLVRITGGRLEGQRLIPKEGPWIDFLSADHPLAAYFKDKTTRYWAVVLDVKSMATFTERARPDDFIDWTGQKAARIRLAADSWDILALPLE